MTSLVERPSLDAPRSRRLDALPVARGLPLLGSALPMFFDPVTFLLEEYRRLGPVFRLHALHHRFVVLAGPDANALLSRTADRHFSAVPGWRRFLGEFGSQHALPGVDGPIHHRLRRLHQRAFSRATISQRLPQALDIAARELHALPAGPTPLLPLCRRIVTEQIGHLILGRGPGDYLDDIVLTVRFALNCLLTTQWPAMVLRYPRYRRARARFLEFARSILEDRSLPPEERPELLQDLQALVAADPDLLRDEDKRMVAIGPFVAGLDTVANTLAFLLYALLLDPAAHARVESESDAWLSEETPTCERLASLTALQGAFRETLRLYSIAPLIYRHVARPFTFSGFEIPTGEPVLIGTTLMHMMPERFPDPHRFDVDRYSRAPEKDEQLYSFGLGPHTCLGMGFAEVQVPLVIAALLHHARFTLDPAAPKPRIMRDPAPTLGTRYRVLIKEFRRPLRA